MQIYNEVVFVSWKLSRETNMIDWIGLFNFDDDNPLHYLDHKGRGVVGPQEGTVAWSVMRANLPPSVDTIQFGYVDGLTGEVLARSPPIRITNKARLIVQEVSYHFFEKSEDPRWLRLASGGKSKSLTLPSDKQSVTVDTHFPYSAVSSLDIAIGSTSCTIPLVEIEHLSGDLNIAVQSDQRHSFTAVVSVFIEPMETEGSARLRPRSKRTDDPSIRVSGVSASSSGSSMSQARDFVAFVNLFADDTQPLPMNWQASGRNPTVFIDHAARRTTLIDSSPFPLRLFDRKRGRSAPPARRQNLDKNGNLLDLASRTAEIALLVEERLPELAPKIRKKLRLIERLGAVALARLANDVDLITAISILDSDDTVVTSEFEEKLNHFYASLHRSGYGKGPQKVKFRFSRSNLLQDAFDQILAADPVTLRRARLSIAFDDEEGLDYGGPSRELFYLLSRELFHPYYGLFEYSAPDQYTVQISPHSNLVQQELQWMELAGRVLGLALLHRCLIDTFFTRTFYKMLLEQPVTVLDLQDVDPEFFRSMMWIRENPIDPSLGMTFVVTEQESGQVVEKELLPNGAALDVSDNNKEEFISLMVKWRVERGVQRQSRALLRGLHQIIDRDFLRVFTVDQVELVLSGSREIDLEDWRKNTEYRGGYFDEHVVIEWFWDRVAQMTNADRLKLLQFVTGTSSIPFEGFAMLRGSNGPKRFTIEKWGEESALPRAHTCFNRLDLPSYPTRHILKAKLHTAITEGISYAIE
ncbi:HECT-domain protein [Teladorsagia circumcincta]|uniref:HECT-type E3 ubiquitin transferase n=1 Tax=Teladorsagia circumcincta TaxID=45464 RepID=A0A2G9UH04_TELCI|nr:HECT-domain protein [Teladorsagia circumcincta]